ncbi:ABC transporter permease subunit [Synechococcus sp. Nb3U1]|uniref:ABC transporter permease n=1 Tax=Synechococcus sp. Nb3U1 TaxID=1914529 RepID=UPI001F32FB7B|nr:ABC transporter permease subunit [Synechococcus sp. Nb3U1]MCF2972569.1 ABC transporter permease subunit [Synechococcus sp. Nb3U1]
MQTAAPPRPTLLTITPIWKDGILYGCGLLGLGLLMLHTSGEMNAATAPVSGWFLPAVLLATLLGGMGCWGLGRRGQGWGPPLLILLLGLVLTQTLLVGYRVPPGLMPTPTRVVRAMWMARAALMRDAVQTFVRQALVGFGLGVGSGLLLGGILARFQKIEQGVLPYLAALSSIPIPALAPVMVGAFGIDWPSKAAVVAVVVLFPVVINTVRGLRSVDASQLDLMRSYGASAGQVFWQVRIPQALPYVFNALKLAMTLAMIGAIVGEFFAAPGFGLGFRIKIEAARFNFDIVWAAILYATVISTLAYGLILRIEKRLTFWHSSIRSEGH